MNHVTDPRTDRPLGRHLHDWLESTVEELPDGAELPSAIRSDVLSRLPGTPQRRRWWPFRWFPFGFGATRSADREGPQREGRPRSMFNAVRVAVVVAALALVGSLAYLAAPTDQSRLTPSAPVRDASDFAGFTGTFSATSCRGGEMTDYEWGHTLEGDYCSPMMLEVSDERLSGTARAVHNGVRFKNGAGFGVRTLTTEVVNEAGPGEGTGIACHAPDDYIMRYEFLLSGRGDYDGLSAMLSLVSDTTYFGHQAQGVIFPGELPPHPVFDGAEPDFEPAGRSEIDPADYGGYHGKISAESGGYAEGASTDGEFGAQTRGGHFWDAILETGDPRMTGVQESFSNTDTFGPTIAQVFATTGRIVTDEGWWDQTTWGYRDPETGGEHWLAQLTGHGAYEGLSAVDVSSYAGRWFVNDIDGVVFPGELPAYPELPPAE